MTLRVIGAGLPRTGTNSQKVALEQLLGGRCYHFFEMFSSPSDGKAWVQALDGDLTAANQLLAGCTAAVDWPASFFWRELLAANPDAVVLLSYRDTPETWWKSINSTVLPLIRMGQDIPGGDGSIPQATGRMARSTFGEDLEDEKAAMAAYEQLIAEVRAEVPAEKLIEWQPSDGWEPICAGLGIPVPDEPFPQVNTAQQFQARDPQAD